MSVTDVEGCCKKLEELGLKYERHDHPAVPTVEEMHAELKKVGLTNMDRVVKTLVLKDKKKGGVVLAVVRSTLKVDFAKILAKKLGFGSGNLRNADAGTISETLAAEPGHITPLAVMNDSGNKVMLVLDKGLADGEGLMYCHPMKNTTTVGMSFSDYEKFFEANGHPPRVTDLEAEDAPAPAKGAAKGGKKDAKAETQVATKQTKLGMMNKKRGDFSKWYQEVITKSEMIEFYDISGCYILRPWSYYIWECISHWFDSQIKESGVQNCYFPCFVSEKKLTKEKDHVEGFEPEVSWVTRSGKTDLAEPIALRPTSEAIMYPAFADWIHSHRDLPLRLNQWCNVVRWEFKNPTPFLRTREFLWQEGHSAYATKAEADLEVLEILGLYEKIYTDLLAVPVIKGKKTEKEKFPGGDYTTTVEGYIPIANRAIQGATSHGLGQNFSKMFEIDFLDQEGKAQKVWQNSWGCTTRTIGVMVMIHSDDKGLVLPPRVAPLHVVIVPIYKKDAGESEEDLTKKKKRILMAADEVAASLKQAGLKVKVDDRENYNPGWKFNHWELKGVPLRFELGMMDIEKGCVTYARRLDAINDPKKRNTYQIGPQIGVQTLEQLEEIQAEMYATAVKDRDALLAQVTKWSEFIPALDAGKMVLVPFCGDEDAEEWIKENSKIEDEVTGQSAGAKSLCIPYEQPSDISDESMDCITGQGRKAKYWTLFGRSY